MKKTEREVLNCVGVKEDFLCEVAFQQNPGGCVPQVEELGMGWK